ncbi:MAG: NHL repeat-containing protein, partial [Patescibacteria group bacterium]
RNPVAVRLDSKERIYILDQGYPRVVRIDDMTGKGLVSFGKSGTNIKDWPSDNEAHCGNIPAPGTYRDDAAVNVFYYSKALEIDSQDRIYVSDKCNYRVVRFDDMTGKNWVSLGGKRGAGILEFGDELNGITVGPDGKLYIADEHNHRIVRVDDMTGKGWISFGSEGSGVNQFNQPHDIAISRSGKIYVADTFYNDRVVRFDDMTGKGWISYGPDADAAPGASKRHLDVPKGIFVVEKE